MVWPTLGSRTAEEQNRTDTIGAASEDERLRSTVAATVSRRRDNSLYDYAGRSGAQRRRM